MDLRDLKPMLLDERPIPFDEPEWIWEIKFDGYRLLAQFGDGKCFLKTKHGADATHWFPEVARSLACIEGGPYITDGEICVLDEKGRSDFERLQERARRRRWVEGGDRVVYAVFDLLRVGDVSLLERPLRQRKRELTDLFTPPIGDVLLVQHFDHGYSEHLFRTVVHDLALEGLVAKRADSEYKPSTRSRDWVKVKRAEAIRDDGVSIDRQAGATTSPAAGRSGQPSRE